MTVIEEFLAWEKDQKHTIASSRTVAMHAWCASAELKNVRISRLEDSLANMERQCLELVAEREVLRNTLKRIGEQWGGNTDYKTMFTALCSIEDMADNVLQSTDVPNLLKKGASKTDIRMVNSSDLTDDLRLLFLTCDVQTLVSKDIGVIEISNGESASTIYVINYNM